MATLYEYYNTGDDGGTLIGGVAWKAQTFTPATAHKITSVKLKLWKFAGDPGTFTVGIRATDASGHPTGSDLCSGSMAGNTITTTSPGLWYEISLGDGYELDADIKYAIVARAPDAGTNFISWRDDRSDPTYPGGNEEESGNSGSSWTTRSTWDCMFEEWYEPPVTTAYKDIAARFRLRVQAFKDTATRFKLAIQGYKDTAVRFLLTVGVQAYKDTSTRFRLWAQAYQDVATRFKLIVQAYEDIVTRFILTALNYQDVATRFRLTVRAYQDVAARFRLTDREYRDIAARFGLSVQAYQGVSTRFFLYQPTWEEVQIQKALVALRVKIAGLELEPGAHFRI